MSIREKVLTWALKVLMKEAEAMSEIRLEVFPPIYSFLELLLATQILLHFGRTPVGKTSIKEENK